MKHLLFICLLIALCSKELPAQQIVQEELVILQSTNLTLSEILARIEKEFPFTFSYNPTNIPLGQRINLTEGRYSLDKILDRIKDEFNLECRVDQQNLKILVTPSSAFSLKGIVYDSLTGESINGTTIIANGEFLGSTNANGYFNISLDKSTEEIELYTLAYKTKILKASEFDESINLIRLQPRLELNVIIRPESELMLFNTQFISVQEIDNHYGTAGGNDLIQNIKFKTGISAGSEGQNGYNSRGGGPHQNLILIDDMPIYEASHLGGLSSIFLPEAIKSIELFRSEFPAQYGGRISSVLDVKLKDGNQKKFSRNISLGLEGLTAHIDGPISNSTSINLNARSSWFSEIARPIVRNYTDVTDLSLRYNDFYTKLTHRFSRTSKLSLSAYLGDDLVKIVRDNSNTLNTGFRDVNRISWGNRFASLSWQHLISDRLNIKLNAGVSRYNYRSRGSFEVVYESADSLARSEFDILSLSNLNDRILKFELDYYTANTGRFKFGMEYIDHDNSPSITERELFTEEEPEFQFSDTTYQAKMVNIYAENRLELSKEISLSSGLRLSNYIISNRTYSYLEPRVSLEFKSKKQLFSLAFSRASQFIHLLSNPGPGLPSELWVPSTDGVAPELSNNFSLSYIQREKNFNIGSSLWIRQFYNLIEYSNSSDIIYSIIIDDELYQLEVNNNNWENRVSIGTGLAYGFELWSSFSVKKLDFKINYTLSRSIRNFDNIDGGASFPYKYDTPHTIATQMLWNLESDKSIIVNWQYSTGTAYSLLDTERLGPDGQPVLVPSSRNNFRLPDFHHLDIHYRWLKSSHTGILEFDLGIYNVYNRLNAFYEYLSQDEASAAAELVKISIYPILPQFKLTYSW